MKGQVKAYTHVLEFQKRGLPHAHILLIFDHDSKPKSAKDVDRLVSAEIPTGDDQQELRDFVESLMTHGPCGAANPFCPCMRDGVCTKNYPKQFQEETTWCEGGYTHYRRRESVSSVNITHNDGIRGNRWVVPYNSWLLKKSKCQLDVEICTSIKAVKYLYKYTFKGPDCANMEIVNEVAEFLDARYVTAPEACWRLFEFPMHARSHVVERLPVHLQNEQPVTFEDGKPK